MNKPIEDWMLTAHALGELEPELAAEVETAIAADPLLQAELDSIRATVSKIGTALQSVAPNSLATAQTAALRESISTAANAIASPKTIASVQVAKRSVFRRNLWLGLTAVAASGLIAVTFGPGLLSKNDQISMTPDFSTAAPQADRPVDSEFAQEELNRKQSLEAKVQANSSLAFDAYGDSKAVDKKLNEAASATVNEDFLMESEQVVNGPDSVRGLERESAELSEELGKSVDTLAAGTSGLQQSQSVSELSAAEPMETKRESGLEAYGELSLAQDAQRDAFGAVPQYDKRVPSNGVELAQRSVANGYDYGYGGAGGGLVEAGGGYGGGMGYGGGAAPVVVGGEAKAESAPAVQNYYLAPPGAPPTNAWAASAPESRALGDEMAIEPLYEEGWQYRRSADSEARYRFVQPHVRLRGLAPNYGIPSDGRLDGDRFAPIEESRFKSTVEEPVTTFSIDVDTASYSKVRQAIMEAGSLPNPNAVRIEELINYFDYKYAGPEDDKPFAAQLAAMECPWQPRHKLVRVALQAKKIESKARPVSNLVFLLDVSGSMNEPNKLPLVKKSISMLVRQLGENDRVAIVVYAGAAGCVLPSTNGIHQSQIMTALDNLQAGGSTNGAQGIELAYQIAAQNYIKGGVNRIVLCTDGDFNVGPSSDEELIQIVERNARENRVFLTCLGFGMGNYNDSMMEKITNKGNGTYGMIDTELEARKVMVEQINATLMTVAKDVKIQVEFNPNQVAGYRLIGYENRKLANQDFNDDKKDAGEIGAGHSVTALYEIVPVGSELPSPTPNEDPLRYAPAAPTSEAKAVEPPADAPQIDPALAKELLMVKVRYKKPEEDVSTKLEFPLTVDAYEKAIDADFRWASSIAMFGMKLRNSAYASGISWTTLIEQATMSAGEDAYRLEAVDLMRRASGMR